MFRAFILQGSEYIFPSWSKSGPLLLLRETSAPGFRGMGRGDRSGRIIGWCSQVFTQNLVQSFDLANSSVRENLELPLFVYLLNGQCRHSAIAKLSEVRLFAKNSIISGSNPDFRMKLSKSPRKYDSHEKWRVVCVQENCQIACSFEVWNSNHVEYRRLYSYHQPLICLVRKD